MGKATPKQFLEVCGKPIFIYALEKFDLCSEVDSIILVVQEEEKERVQTKIAQWNIRKVQGIATGGIERQDSVWNGLNLLSEDVGVIVVHDAVRPFVSAEKIGQVIMAARKKGAAVLAVPVKDTIKRVEGQWVRETLNRRTLYQIQTPQAFRADWLRAAYEKARKDRYCSTDDAALVERLGHRVAIVEGEERNIKITSSEDLFLAEMFIREAAC